MRRYTRIDYHKRTAKRWWNRHYKGLSDLLAITFFIVGFFLTSTGFFLTMTGNYTSVLDISIGLMLLVASSDLWQYGRRHGKRNI